MAPVVAVNEEFHGGVTVASCKKFVKTKKKPAKAGKKAAAKKGTKKGKKG